LLEAKLHARPVFPFQAGDKRFTGVFVYYGIAGSVCRLLQGSGGFKPPLRELLYSNQAFN
jgi:hypothetical protein